MAHEIPDFGNAKDEARIQKALLLLESVEKLEALMEDHPLKDVILSLDSASKRERFICFSNDSQLDGLWVPTLVDAIITSISLASTLGGK